MAYPTHNFSGKSLVSRKNSPGRSRTRGSLPTYASTRLTPARIVPTIRTTPTQDDGVPLGGDTRRLCVCEGERRGVNMNKNLDPTDVSSPGPKSGPQQTVETGVPVVGIGGSAGGLEAFRLVLASLPNDTGLAVVIIQHLDPTHDSSLREILGRSSKMPVLEALDNTPVEPNHVYVIPPNTEMTITKGVLRLHPRSKVAGLHMPIDRFLRSLAEDCHGKAFGVILSGSGSDGSLGLQSIRESGGVTFAQEPSTAEFPSMPQSAEAASCVDFVLPPAGIAAELARIAQDPHFAFAQPTEPDTPSKEGSGELKDILAVMLLKTGVDFSLYREKTVQRRISDALPFATSRRSKTIWGYSRRIPPKSVCLQETSSLA